MQCPTCKGEGKVSNTVGAIVNLVNLFDKTKRNTPAQPAYVPCSTCGQRGALICGACKGRRVVLTTCTNCGGTGMATRQDLGTVCRGAKKTERVVRWEQCIGGKVKDESLCAACNGQGKVWKSERGTMAQ